MLYPIAAITSTTFFLPLKITVSVIIAILYNTSIRWAKISVFFPCPKSLKIWQLLFTPSNAVISKQDQLNIIPKLQIAPRLL